MLLLLLLLLLTVVVVHLTIHHWTHFVNIYLSTVCPVQSFTNTVQMYRR